MSYILISVAKLLKGLYKYMKIMRDFGTSLVTGNGLNFLIDNNLAFEIPLNNVCQATPLKNEITLEFHQNDDAAVSLMELRFHIPSDQNNPDADNVSVSDRKTH